MAPFKPVTFCTARGYEFHVSCLHHVAKALEMAWPDKTCALYRRAACLTERARQGWCTPRVAYDAFLAAARAQGRIVEPRKLHDRVAQELAAIEPENFIFHPSIHPGRLRTRRVPGSVAGTLRRSHV